MRRIDGATEYMSDDAGQPPAADDERWVAITTRDAAAAPPFVYGVITTGVYCRPGCAARQPRRINVRCFADALTAERAGFRACKRCSSAANLAGEHQAAIARALALLDGASEAPPIAALAAVAGLSRSRFHRIFRDTVGITPQQYIHRWRMKRLDQQLSRGARVTDAALDAGFSSNNRLYDSGNATGLAPAQRRRGAPGEDIRYGITACALGLVAVAATARGICAIELGDDVAGLLQRLSARFAHAHLAQDPALHDWLAQIVAQIDRPAASLSLPLDIQGTAFQQRVWRSLQQIPLGSTRSYRTVADEIGQPGAARAVAAACAANPLAIVVPCHRVVREDGSLSGYRWGVERKRDLLEREAAARERAAADADDAMPALRHAPAQAEGSGTIVTAGD
jgi:AraC family transcriptional regulator of adaptative response/methylated-DNA-[protein]-cysteine methyltransferase